MKKSLEKKKPSFIVLILRGLFGYAMLGGFLLVVLSLTYDGKGFFHALSILGAIILFRIILLSDASLNNFEKVKLNNLRSSKKYKIVKLYFSEVEPMGDIDDIKRYLTRQKITLIKEVELLKILEDLENQSFLSKTKLNNGKQILWKSNQYHNTKNIESTTIEI